MQLLDLPPELLAEVIRLCVNNDNVREASKQRVTCKIFKSFLDDELFARTPVGSFIRARDKSARTLLKNKLGSHLAHRALNTGNLYGAHHFLPHFIKNRLDLLRIMNVLKDGNEYAYALMLANQLAVGCSCAYILATSRSTSLHFQRILPRFHLGNGNQVVEQMAATAAVGCLPVVQHLIRIHGSTHLWDCSYPLGHPLAAAAGGNHMELAQAIVADCKDNYREELNEAYRAAFISAIDISLARQHSKMSLFLIEAYHNHFPVVSKQSFAKWLAKATVDPDDRIYLQLVALGSDAGARKHIEPFELACEFGNVSYVRRFFENGILHLNQGFPLYKEFYHVQLKTPLSIAIGAGGWPLVEVLLSIEADPDGQPICWPCDRLLYRALEMNKLGHFLLLLLWGADRGLIADAWNSTGEQFKALRLGFLPYLRGGVGNEAIYFVELARRLPGHPGFRW